MSVVIAMMYTKFLELFREQLYSSHAKKTKCYVS